MEEEAPSRRSVAELAGRFKGTAPPNDAAKNETEKPVRRRPPRSLQLAKTTGDEQEPPPDVTSPGPGKPKRNSALIEKLQANLVLSPTNMGPPLKSPGVRLLPPSFVPPFPGSAPETTATTSSMATPTSPVHTVFPSASQEEGPTSFEAPPTAVQGSILPSINKGRARHSIRRRPPSRRHRKSSTEDDGGDTPLTSPTEPDGKMAGEGGGGGGEEKKGGGGGAEEDKKEGPEEDGSPKEDQLKNGVQLQGEEEKKQEEKKEEEKKEEVKEEVKEEEKKEEEDGEKMETEEENQEKISTGKQEEEPMNVDSKEEKMEETTCPSST